MPINIFTSNITQVFLNKTFTFTAYKKSRTG